MLEARLSKIDGIQSAKVRGYDKESKFYFNLSVSEGKSVLPGHIRKMLEDLKKETKGDEDYPYNSMEITSITGTIEKSGNAWSFKARGSGQVYGITPTDDVKKLVDEGKKQFTLAGKVTDENGLKIELSCAKESAN